MLTVIKLPDYNANSYLNVILTVMLTMIKLPDYNANGYLNVMLTAIKLT